MNNEEEKTYTLKYSNDGFVFIDNYTGNERVVTEEVARANSNQVDVYVDDTAKKML